MNFGLPNVAVYNLDETLNLIFKEKKAQDNFREVVERVVQASMRGVLLYEKECLNWYFAPCQRQENGVCERLLIPFSESACDQKYLMGTVWLSHEDVVVSELKTTFLISMDSTISIAEGPAESLQGFVEILHEVFVDHNYFGAEYISPLEEFVSRDILPILVPK